MKIEMGLTVEEAERRLKQYGSNELIRRKKTNPLKLFALQFTSPVIVLLIAAALISFGIGLVPGQAMDGTNALLILIIVFASGFSGFFQEYKAEKTIESLQKMATPNAIVIRDGKRMEISSIEVVPGDLIVLGRGNAVPADATLIKSLNLQVNESTLSGESAAVEKKVNDQVYMNTYIFSGQAEALVLKTGMDTKIGNIAEKLQELKDEETSFQSETADLSKGIFWAVIVIAILMTAAGLVKYGIYQSLLLAVALAVAAIPEALPAVTTITLALNANIMAKKDALVRKLTAIESIGAVDIICTDKTGTLTENRMTVTNFFINNMAFDVPTNGTKEAKMIEPILTCGAACNNSVVMYEKRKKNFAGDQTEIALRKMAERFNITKKGFENKYKKINEVSFTSEREMMSVVFVDRKNRSRFLVYSKGAPEILIEKCDREYVDGKIVKLRKENKKIILEQNKRFASKALRVLGFAFKETKSSHRNVEKGLIWLGLQALMDPPRKEVKAAITDCMNAGIRIIMLTGDSASTAKAIGDRIGLYTKRVAEGKEIDQLTDKQLKEKLYGSINIFARVSPFHKLRILEILKKDQRVAMTGDGVNDALALKKADVGIAMGIRGTDVAKQASDIILLDDNFATIKSAIAEGRKSFENIRKFLSYLLTSNLAEVAVLFLSTIFLTLSEPILFPVQLLWINLLTDGFPAIALGVDPARPGIMRSPPRKKNEPIINKRLMWIISAIGIKKMVILFAAYFLTLPLGVEIARTTLFTGFILYEFVRIAVIRAQDELKWYSNKWLVGAVVGSLLLQLFIIYSPFNKFLGVVPLGIYEWGILIVGIVIAYIISIIMTKFIVKHVKD